MSAAARDKLLPEIEVFTDGGCSPNPGPGGWAAILRCKELDLEKELSGFAAHTTNNRMELTAALRALEALKRPCNVTLTTDSQYLADAFRRRWLEHWKLKGWRTANKKPVKNQDLWRALDELIQRHSVRWVWIPGHAGHPENERCDRLVQLVCQRGVQRRISK
jgi:ribonuclease HI